MSVSGYIPNDGYNETALISGVERLYPPLRFTFRPILLAERAAYIQAMEQCKPPKLREVEAALLAKKLVRWDLSDGSATVGITEANLMRVKSALFSRLFRIVVGEDAGDPDPEAASDDSAGADILEAIRRGQYPLSVREEGNAKN